MKAGNRIISVVPAKKGDNVILTSFKTGEAFTAKAVRWLEVVPTGRGANARSAKAIPVVSKTAFSKAVGVNLTGCQGKMKDVYAYTTSCLCNPHCECTRKLEGSVCAHCYAATALLHGPYRNNLRPAYERNSGVLSGYILPCLPNLDDYEIFRLETHGDLINVTHAINYLLISAANRKTNVALWTKRPDIIAQAVDELDLKDKRLPDLLVNVSSYYLNQAFDWEKIHRTYPFVNKLFTVYSPEYIEEHKIKINCGARDCNLCRRCYRSTSCHIINEKLKPNS